MLTSVFQICVSRCASRVSDFAPILYTVGMNSEPQIPVFRPSITDAEIEAVTRVLRSGWLGLGPETARFESKLKEYIGCADVVVLNSGTAALHLALVAAGVGEGDEVLVPTITFVSTAHAAKYVGAEPVFVDVDERTLCIDLEDAARKVTPKTKAIIPVHYGGHPCPMNAVTAFAEENNLVVIEDAAHAMGAQYQERRVGAISPYTAFSFHAVKNLTCGEGGAVAVMDEERGRYLRKIRWLGISKDTFVRTDENNVYAWQYDVSELGWKAHGSDLGSALGIVQLQRLDENNGARRAIRERYDEAFGDLGWLRLPPEAPDSRSSWHIYPIQLERRDALIAHLKSKNIAPGVHYFPLHLHPYYKNRESACPKAEGLWKRILTLPCFPDMTDHELERVVEAVRDFGES